MRRFDERINARGLARSAVIAAFALLAASCEPSLGDAPFACDAAGACPSGYTCASGQCLRDGTRASAARVSRVTWINAAEMSWFPSLSSGAVLVYNDGFTEGGRGLYEVVVTRDGAASAPRLLQKYGEEFPTASAVGLLDDGRYVVVSLAFPTVERDSVTLRVVAIEREAKGHTPAVEVLFTAERPYLGGSEPPYVALLAAGGAVDLAWTTASDGGAVALTRLEQRGSVWQAVREESLPLPPRVLPLSGDCQLWDNPAGGMTLRIGFENYSVARINEAGEAAPFEEVDDLPLYAFGDNLLLLRYGSSNVQAGTSEVSVALGTAAGVDVGVDDAGLIQDATEPYTAVPLEDGAIFAPLAGDPAMKKLRVGFRSPTQALTTIATIERPGSDPVYSARPFVRDGQVYLAWTTFHEALMDLWIGTAPREGAP